MQFDRGAAGVSIPPNEKRRARALLEAYILQEPKRRSIMRVASRSTVVSVAACFIVLAASAAGAYVAFSPATDQRQVQCFTVADRVPESGYGTTVGQAEAGGDGIAMIDDAVSACRDLWEIGLLQRNAETVTRPEDLPPDQLRQFDAPILTGCVLNTGQAGVFPAGPDVCERLGLTQLSR